MTQSAKKLVLVILLAIFALPVFGCGVGTTVAENSRTIGRIWDYDARMLTDDAGLLALARRPFHGSRYAIK